MSGTWVVDFESHFLKNNNSMDHIPSWQANSTAAIQEHSYHLWVLTVHYHVQKSHHLSIFWASWVHSHRHPSFLKSLHTNNKHTPWASWNTKQASRRSDLTLPKQLCPSVHLNGISRPWNMLLQKVVPPESLVKEATGSSEIQVPIHRQRSITFQKMAIFKTSEGQNSFLYFPSFYAYFFKVFSSIWDS